MRILLLGGTGAMGVPLIGLLADKGNEICVTSRNEHTSKENVKYFAGDARDTNFLDEMLYVNYDVIVDFMSYKTDEFSQRVGKLLDSTKQYIFISSARVYSNCEDLITERTPRLLDVCQEKEYMSSDEYALTKARQENILYENEKKNWTIIRPYITYNNERLQLGVYEKELWLYRILNNKTIVFPKDMSGCFTTLSYGMDVSKVILQLIGKQEAMGETFHITSSQKILWKEVIDIYSEIIKTKTNTTMKINYVNNSKSLSRILFSQRWQIYHDRLYNRIFDNEKVEKMCSDTIEFQEIHAGLEKCLGWFIENKESLKPMKPVAHAYMDRICKEYTPVKEFEDKKAKVKYLCMRYIPVPLEFYTIIYSGMMKFKKRYPI